MKREHKNKQQDEKGFWCRSPKNGEITTGISVNGMFPINDESRTSWDSTSMEMPQDNTDGTVTRSVLRRKQ